MCGRMLFNSFATTVCKCVPVCETCVCPRLCLKRQVIDLLAEGYSSKQLDAQPPVTVEDW